MVNMLTVSLQTNCVVRAELGGIFHALAREVQTGLVGPKGYRAGFGPVLRERQGEWEALVGTGSQWAAHLAVLRRFTDTFDHTNNGAIVPSVDLRQAAQAVYQALAEGFGPLEHVAAMSVAEQRSLTKDWNPDLPTVDETIAAFQEFSPAFREELTAVARQLVASRGGHQFQGTDLDHNATFLRGAVLTWMGLHYGQHGSFSEALGPLQEIFSWLGSCSDAFTQTFFLKLYGKDWMKGKGAGYVTELVEQVNRHAERSFVFNTVAVAGSETRRCYVIRELVPDQDLVERMNGVLGDSIIAEALRRLAAMPSGAFYSTGGLPVGLARAVVALGTDLRRGKFEHEYQSRMALLASALSLVARGSGVIESKGFFRPRLVTAGLTVPAQQALVCQVNQACGTKFEMVYQHNVWLESKDPRTVPSHDLARFCGCLDAVIGAIREGVLTMPWYWEHLGPEIKRGLPYGYAQAVLSPSLVVSVDRLRKSLLSWHSVEVRHEDLSQACAALRDELSRSLSEAELMIRHRHGADVMGKIPRQGHLPPSDVKDAFDGLPQWLQAELRTVAERLQKCSRAGFQSGAQVDWSSGLFSLTMRTWLVARFAAMDPATPEWSDETLEAVAAICHWLAGCSAAYGSKFLTSLMDDKIMFSHRETILFREAIARVNQRYGTSFQLGRSRGRKGHRYCSLTHLMEDGVLKGAMVRIIPEARIRDLIVAQSGLSEAAFFANAKMARDGLTRAFVALYPYNKDEAALTELGETERLAALAALFQLLVAEDPFISEDFFVASRLRERGFSYPVMVHLFRILNQRFGTHFGLMPRYGQLTVGRALEVRPRTEENVGPVVAKVADLISLDAWRKQGAKDHIHDEEDEKDEEKGGLSPRGLQRRRMERPAANWAQLKPGVWVVRPGVGVGQILDIRREKLGGYEVPIYEVRYLAGPAQTTLRGLIPSGSVRSVGLRLVSDGTVLSKVRTILQRSCRSRVVSQGGAYRRFQEDCYDRLWAGTPEAVAVLLHILYEARFVGPSYSCWMMETFDKALDALATELAVILDCEAPDVKAMKAQIMTWLKGGPGDVPDQDFAEERSPVRLVARA